MRFFLGECRFGLRRSFVQVRFQEVPDVALPGFQRGGFLLRTTFGPQRKLDAGLSNVLIRGRSTTSKETPAPPPGRFRI